MFRNRLLKRTAIATAAMFAVAACGTDGEGEDGEAVAAGMSDEEFWESVDIGEPGWPRDPVFTDPSLSTLDVVFERDRFTIIYHTLPALDRHWDEVFDEVNLTYMDDPAAPLVSGAAWLVQGEPGLLWPALEQGVVDGVIVGITNDVEEWMLMCNENVSTPEELVGARITGGDIGDIWNTIAEIIIRDEFGLDSGDVDWISVSGGSDGRMEAALVGEVDCFMGQPRNLQPTLDAGGHALYDETVENAHLQFVVDRETWEQHPDAVCAALEGHLDTVVWLDDYEEENAVDKWPEIAEHFERHGYDTEGGEAQWVSGYPGILSHDLGADAEGLDRMLEIHTELAADPVLSADFDWRDHADFSCTWKLQEAYGLDLNPDPADL